MYIDSMFDWLQSVSSAVVSVVFGVLTFIGIQTPNVPMQMKEVPHVVIEVESVMPTSTPTKTVTAPTKKMEERAGPETTVPPVAEPTIETLAPKIGLEVLPEFTILLKPIKGQYTAEEIRILNEEAINYFKAYSTCEGLVGWGLTYCRTFEASPEIQLWRLMLQHNAEVDTRNATSTSN